MITTPIVGDPIAAALDTITKVPTEQIGHKQMRLLHRTGCI
jgi:hypothetical protein